MIIPPRKDLFILTVPENVTYGTLPTTLFDYEWFAIDWKAVIGQLSTIRLNK